MEDQNRLLERLVSEYDIAFCELATVRDWVGKVYSAKSPDGRLCILKLFRPQHAEAARVSADVMAHLRAGGVNVPMIYRTVSGGVSFEYEGFTAVLYEFIDGIEVERDGAIARLGEISGGMCSAMADYKGALPEHGREFFLDRYLDIMRRAGYPRVSGFEELADSLWAQVSGLPKGFCHGDYHCGNMFLRGDDIIVYDFDACALRSPAYDAATMCDATDYFSLAPENFSRGYEKTLDNLEEFMGGFGRKHVMASEELAAVPAFIAIRHFDIQATIIAALGEGCVDNDFYDRQLKWLELWTKQFI